MAIRGKASPEELQRFYDSSREAGLVPAWMGVLFSIQDTPLMKALALYREQPYRDNAGYQAVSSHFASRPSPLAR